MYGDDLFTAGLTQESDDERLRDASEAFLHYKQASQKVAQEKCSGCGKMHKGACGDDTSSTHSLKAVTLPRIAGSSIHAALSGELPVKTAGLASKALKKISPGSALSWGAIGAAGSAATARPGHRLEDAVKGGLVSGALGAYAPAMELAANRKALNLLRQRGNSNQLSLPFGKTAEKKEDLSLWEKLRRVFSEYRNARSELASGPVKVPKADDLKTVPVSPKTASFKELASHALPKGLLTPEGIGAGLGMGGLLGAGAYLTSRPQKDLGGRSAAEAALERQVSSFEPDDDDSLPKRVGHRLLEFNKDLATEFRKSPAASGAIGAAVGVGLGLRLARILGAGK